jgi:hypothetical protein
MRQFVFDWKDCVLALNMKLRLKLLPRQEGCAEASEAKVR